MSLQQTIDLGKNQFETFEALTRKIKGTQKSYANATTIPTAVEAINQNSIVPTKSTANTRPNIKLLSSTEMFSHRERGLCFNCDEKFVPLHKCKHRIYILMTEDEEMLFT